MLETYFQKRANRLFLIISFFGISFLAFLLLLLKFLFFQLPLFFHAFLGKAETLCGCSSHFIFSNHPIFFSLAIMLVAFILILLIHVLVRSLLLYRRTRRFLQRRVGGNREMLEEEKRQLGISEFEGRIVKTEEHEPHVFCYGFFRPKVCISSGLIELLSQSELLAVLQHEMQHAMEYEPLKIFLIKIFEKALFFFPPFQKLLCEYFTLSELSADQAATENFMSKKPLAGALYKMIEYEKRVNSQQQEKTLALSFFQYLTEERVNVLVDANYSFPKKFAGIIKTSTLLLIFVFLFFFGLKQTPALSSQYGSECVVPDETAHLECLEKESHASCSLDTYAPVGAGFKPAPTGKLDACG